MPNLPKSPDGLMIRVDPRIHLSALHPSDKDSLVLYLNDRDIYERTLRIPFPYREADAESFLNQDLETTARHGHPVHFAIRDESERAIGGFGFEGLVYGHRAEIGYWLARPFWGQGIMTAVVAAMSAYAFSEWKLVRLTAHVFDFNAASARVLKKNGFALEGTLRKCHQKNEQFIDSLLYALVP